MNRYDIVTCISCGAEIKYKDAEISKQGSPNYGIPTEYICEKCYQEGGYKANAVLIEGYRKRRKNFI